MVANSLPCHFRPDAQDLDGAPQGPGLAGGKPEDAEEEEEDLEEDEDSLAGKSQDDVDAVSPTPEPRGAYEDEEDEEPPTSLAVGFDHTRRWVLAQWASRWGGGGTQAPRGDSPPHRQRTRRPGWITVLPRVGLPQGEARPGAGARAQPAHHTHTRTHAHATHMCTQHTRTAHIGT